VGIGTATEAVAGVLVGVFATAMQTVNFLLNEADGEQGIDRDAEWLGKFAAGAMDRFMPLVNALWEIRSAAAEAGAAVGGVAAGLEEISKYANMQVHIWIYTHEQTIHEPDVYKGGGTGTGTGTGTCFPAGTLIALGDGSNVPIENVITGMRLFRMMPTNANGLPAWSRRRSCTRQNRGRCRAQWVLRVIRSTRCTSMAHGRRPERSRRWTT